MIHRPVYRSLTPAERRLRWRLAAMYRRGTGWEAQLAGIGIKTKRIARREALAWQLAGHHHLARLLRKNAAR